MKKGKLVGIFLCALCILGSMYYLQRKEPVADTARCRTITRQPAMEKMDGPDVTFLRLQEKFWNRMDAVQRRDLLQFVADTEAQRLGIESPAVCARKLEGNVLGVYSDSDKLITLDLEYMKDSEMDKVLATVCHECYHAYQHRLVEVYNRLEETEKQLMLFRPLAQYAAEFANYNDGSEDYAAYSAQQCEIDSEAYAAQAVQEYNARIQAYRESSGLSRQS